MTEEKQHPQEWDNPSPENQSADETPQDGPKVPDMPYPSADDDLEQELAEALGQMNLESLMDTDAAMQSPGTGEGVRRGRVIAVEGGDVFVDMGGKSQGILPAEQWGDGTPPTVGDVVEVTVEGYEPAEGLLLLSRRGAIQAAAWHTLSQGQLVEGRVTGHNKGGLEMDVNGIKAFMPISQIDFERIETDDLRQFTNRRLPCEVVEIRHSERTIVVSRRNALQRQREEARADLLDTLEEGQLVTGTVKTIMPYGVFVDIGGVDGLVHVSDLSYSRVEDPAEVVTEGQQLQVQILGVDRESGRIALGLKQVMPDPWKEAEAKYAPGSLVTGRVTRLVDFGAFVELEPGVEGLVPIGEITYERRIGHPREVLSEGQVVHVRVLNVDMAAGRISLSVKQAGEDPWIGASVRWPVDSGAEGVVRRTTEFGAFVEMAPGVEGLVHISELADRHVRRVEEVVRVGQQVKVKVLDVDEDRRRMSLSLKRYAETPEASAALAPEPTRPPKKRKKPLKGGLDW